MTTLCLQLKGGEEYKEDSSAVQVTGGADRYVLFFPFFFFMFLISKLLSVCAAYLYWDRLQVGLPYRIHISVVFEFLPFWLSACHADYELYPVCYTTGMSQFKLLFITAEWGFLFVLAEYTSQPQTIMWYQTHQNHI